MPQRRLRRQRCPLARLVAIEEPSDSPSQANSNVSHNDLLHATALLSLETARKVRLLSSVTTRTIFVPDTAALSTPMKALVASGRSYHETEHAYAWAQLILATLGYAATTYPLLHGRPYATMPRPHPTPIHYWTTSYSASWSAAMPVTVAT